MHLAGAAKAKNIILVGHTYPAIEHQKPLNKDSKVLFHKRKGYDKVPIVYHGHKEERENINLITIEEVKNEINKFLRRR